MAIQYLVPAVTLVADKVAVFHAPFTGLEIVVCAKSVPGTFEVVLVYIPTTTWVPVLALSIYTYMRVPVPLVLAVY